MFKPNKDITLSVVIFDTSSIATFNKLDKNSATSLTFAGSFFLPLMDEDQSVLGLCSHQVQVKCSCFELPVLKHL